MGAPVLEQIPRLRAREINRLSASVGKVVGIGRKNSEGNSDRPIGGGGRRRPTSEPSPQGAGKPKKAQLPSARPTGSGPCAWEETLLVQFSPSIASFSWNVSPSARIDISLPAKMDFPASNSLRIRKTQPATLDQRPRPHFLPGPGIGQCRTKLVKWPAGVPTGIRTPVDPARHFRSTAYPVSL